MQYVSVVAESLTIVLRKSIVVIEVAFGRQKDIHKSTPVLVAPDFHKLFSVSC